MLKLPLRRQRQDPHPVTGKPQMDLAKDVGRRELFGQVYSFLHHCAAVETPTGALVHNPKIQASRPCPIATPLLPRHGALSGPHAAQFSPASNTEGDGVLSLLQSYLAARLDLFITHIGVLNLNVASTLSAVFKANPILSRRCINISILRRFVTLLMTYGEKKRTRWLSFLHNTVVVDGMASPANQSAVLNLVRLPSPPSPFLSRGLSVIMPCAISMTRQAVNPSTPVASLCSDCNSVSFSVSCLSAGLRERGRGAGAVQDSQSTGHASPADGWGLPPGEHRERRDRPGQPPRVSPAERPAAGGLRAWGQPHVGGQGQRFLQPSGGDPLPRPWDCRQDGVYSPAKQQ